jgi:hypothetical protein
MKERSPDPFFHVLFCPLGMDVSRLKIIWIHKMGEKAILEKIWFHSI